MIVASSFLVLRGLVIIFGTLFIVRIMFQKLGVDGFAVFVFFNSAYVLLTAFSSTSQASLVKYFSKNANDQEAMVKVALSGLIINTIIFAFLAVSLLIYESYSGRNNLYSEGYGFEALVWTPTIAVFFLVTMNLASSIVVAFLIIKNKVNVVTFFTTADIALKYLVLSHESVSGESIVSLYFYLTSIHYCILIVFGLVMFRGMFKIKGRLNTNLITFILEYARFYFWNLFGGGAQLARENAVNLLVVANYSSLVASSRGVVLQIYNTINSLSAQVGIILLREVSSNSLELSKERPHTLIRGSIAFFGCIALLLCPFLVIFGDLVLKLWLGDTFPAQAPTYLSIIAFGLFFELVSRQIIPLILSKGSIGLYQVIVGSINLGFVFVCFFLIQLNLPPVYVFYSAVFFSFLLLLARYGFAMKYCSFKVFINFKLTFISASVFVITIFSYQWVHGLMVSDIAKIMMASIVLVFGFLALITANFRDYMYALFTSKFR